MAFVLPSCAKNILLLSELCLFAAVISPFFQFCYQRLKRKNGYLRKVTVTYSQDVGDLHLAADFLQHAKNVYLIATLFSPYIKRVYDTKDYTCVAS